MKKSRAEALADLQETDPITLREASEIVLRGVVSVSALRAEIARGNLVVEKIGKNHFTSQAAIREMRQKCRVVPSSQHSISAKTTEPGSSGMEERKSERDALKAIVTALKNGSLIGSQGSKPRRS